MTSFLMLYKILNEMMLKQRGISLSYFKGMFLGNGYNFFIKYRFSEINV